MKRVPHILVVGSLVLDQIGTTTVFPKEGETVFGQSFSTAPGGKGANQAVQCARLGAKVTMVGKIGTDSNGQIMLAACKASGINTDHIMTAPECATGCSMIILEEGIDGSRRNRILVLPGANMTIRPMDLTFLEEAITQYDLVMLQLEIPMEVNVYVAQCARRHGIPVMLNSAPSSPLPPELTECLTYISPNEHEAQDLTGVVIAHRGSWVDEEAVKEAAAILQKKGAKNVLITLGSAGAAMVTEVGFMFSPAVPDVRCVDPTAAGDSFVGAFCYAVCAGLTGQQALRFANCTAARTVSRMGAMPSLPSMEELLEYLPDDVRSAL